MPGKAFRYLRLSVLVTTLSALVTGQSLAPGGPGKDAQWMTAGKQAIGTSATSTSKVWFTLADGVLSEVYYPDLTTANVQMLQFVVLNRKLKTIETEQNDTTHEIHSLGMYRSEKILDLPSVTSVAEVRLSEMYRGVSMPNSMSFRQLNRSRSRSWSIAKTYLTDPFSQAILFAVDFCSKDPNDEFYIYYDPSLANSGLHDSGWNQGRAFVASDGAISSALICGRCKFLDSVNAFYGVNDGLTQLLADGGITAPYTRAESGNIIQVARVVPTGLDPRNRRSSLIFALAFGKTADEALISAQKSLTKGWDKTYQEYQMGWLEYLKSFPKVDPKYQPQFNMAAMVLKALEDKSHPGANIASPSIPWGGGTNANENNVGGYHLVWSRDLYQVATAYLALGDKAAANRALDFLFNVQQRPDGSFPQNSWLDGKPFWNSLQMDEVAYPLILAYQLGRYDRATYENHVEKAADFIVMHGPATPQERWEEESGYSPSTIAAEIAGLVCAADIAQKNGDRESADRWLKTADDWQANVEKWTATTTGKYGDGHYYLRITQHGKPDAGDKIELNNGAGTFDEREIVDAGFLELVRLGVKPANDPLIEKSVKVIDQVIKVDTPSGPAFYRYNHDGYGEEYDGRRWNWDGKYSGNGHLWTLITGERGEFEIAGCGLGRADLHAVRRSISDPPSRESATCLSLAASRLDDMLRFANDGLMIPEQVWDTKETPKIADHQFVPDLQFGKGTGSATPLAWSMAQFIRLAINLKAGRNLETPDVVFDRYVRGKH